MLAWAPRWSVGQPSSPAGTTAPHKGQEGGDILLVFGSVKAMRRPSRRVDRLRSAGLHQTAVIEATTPVPLRWSSPEGIPVQTPPSAGYNYDPGGKHRIIGPNCPGIISPGQGQRRHHPRRPSPAQADRPGVQVGDADLPDDVRVARLRLLHGGRHRWRPHHRHHPHRRPRPSRPTPRPSHRHDRRDGGDAEERQATTSRTT